jgi:hypothetical protein
VGQKFNGAYQLLVYASDLSLLVHNIDTIKKNIGTLIGAVKLVASQEGLSSMKYAS